jgi:hypothetical protein
MASRWSAKHHFLTVILTKGKNPCAKRSPSQTAIRPKKTFSPPSHELGIKEQIGVVRDDIVS